MAPSRDELEARELFAERYGRPGSDVTRDLERLVIGSDWGANGYTTLAQADLLAERLALTRGKRLLDLGSGRGWPGLYLAKRTGCTVVLSDLPLAAMRSAANRAGHEGISDRVSTAVASARRLPFAPASFDGITHTDVLCWLSAKLSVLRASRRLLVSGGTTAFFTIFVSPGLSKRDHRRAVRLGPRAVAAGHEQPELLRRAGFVGVEDVDVTEAFLGTARRWLRHARELEPDLRQALGDDVVDQQFSDRADIVTAIEDGLVRRSLLVGLAPNR